MQRRSGYRGGDAERGKLTKALREPGGQWGSRRSPFRDYKSVEGSLIKRFSSGNKQGGGRGGRGGRVGRHRRLCVTVRVRCGV